MYMAWICTKKGYTRNLDFFICRFVNCQTEYVPKAWTED